MKLRTPFKTAVLVLVWGWILLFVLVPNLLVVAASFLTRDDVHFIRWQGTLDNYLRLLDPDYLAVFSHSFYMAVVTTLLCLLVGYPFAYLISRLRNSLKPYLLFLVIVPFWTNSLVRTYAMKLPNKGRISQNSHTQRPMSSLMSG